MRILRLAVFVALIVCIFLFQQDEAQAVRNDAWTVIGPGGGGAQFHPTISPHDPGVVLVGCDMTGTYLTTDAGKNWRMINLHGVARFFVFDPSDAKTFYVRTIGLWRTSDRGATWQLVYPKPSDVTGIAMRDDHASAHFLTKTESESVDALAVDPNDSRTLYAVFSARRSPSLRISSDSGQTWKTIEGDLPERASQIYIDPQSPVKNRTAYIVGASGIATLTNGRLQETAAPPEEFISVSGGFSQNKFIAYGISRTAAYISRDSGKTWTRSVPASEFRAVAASQQHAETAYLSYGSLTQDGKRYSGVLKTTDAGASWTPVWKESKEKSPNVDDGWVSRRFGPGWGGEPLDLGVSPTHPEIAYSTDFGRTLRTTDGGVHWIATYTRSTPRQAWTTTGLDVTTNYGVHFDPFDPKHMFISYTDIGLFASDDGGASWYSATTSGVPRRWVNTTYWLVFDPEVRGRMWAVMSGTHDLPRPKMWRHASPSSYVGGVARSDDGGRTWKPQTTGIPQTAATHILLDPRSPADARVLYVAGFGKGVFRSSDGGATWQQKNSGLPSPEPFAWRFALDRNGVLYLVIARRSEHGSIGDANDGGLYRSTNQGDSWERVPLPDGVNGPNGIAIDPEDPKRLYLAAWRRNTNDPTAGGGIYLSTDGGSTWRCVLAKDQHVYDVTIDPDDKSILYACGFESSAWRSTDRGETWRRIRGYNFKWGHRVIPDPRDRSKIFVTTFGGSVWHGPAAGDPNAIEDITTPVAAFSR